jgi:hypothetical protein
MTPSIATLSFGLSLALVGWVSICGRMYFRPAYLYPVPSLLAIPAFLVGLSLGGRRGHIAMMTIASALGPLLFWLWSYQLFTGEANFPVRTFVLCLLLVAANVAWLNHFRIIGIRERGESGYRSIANVSVIGAVAAVGLAVVAYSLHVFEVSLLAHWVLFAWLNWSAFPWLTEAP